MIHEDGWKPPEAWLVLIEMDGNTHIDPADEGALDGAVSRYLDSGCTRDELLCLTFSEGGRYRVRASRVVGWWLCTAEHTRRNLIRTEAQKETEKLLRAELGLPWKEDE
jgi:hypothetical protein